MDQKFSVEAAREAYEKLLAEGMAKPGAALKSERTNRKKLRWDEIRTMQIGIDLLQISIPFSLEKELYLKCEGIFCEYCACTSLIVSKAGEGYHFEVFSQLFDEESPDENLDYSFNCVEITEDIFGNLIEAYYYKNKKLGIITSDQTQSDIIKEFEWYQSSKIDGARDADTFNLLYTEKLFFKWLTDDESRPAVRKLGPAFGSVWLRDPGIAVMNEVSE